MKKYTIFLASILLCTGNQIIQGAAKPTQDQELKKEAQDPQKTKQKFNKLIAQFMANHRAKDIHHGNDELLALRYETLSSIPRDLKDEHGKPLAQTINEALDNAITQTTELQVIHLPIQVNSIPQILFLDKLTTTFDLKKQLSLLTGTSPESISIWFGKKKLNDEEFITSDGATNISYKIDEKIRSTPSILDTFHTLLLLQKFSDAKQFIEKAYSTTKDLLDAALLKSLLDDVSLAQKTFASLEEQKKISVDAANDYARTLTQQESLLLKKIGHHFLRPTPLTADPKKVLQGLEKRARIEALRAEYRKKFEPAG